jgi:hypothetical protein
MFVAAISLFIRLRRARGPERQQIKWFVYAVALVVSAAIVAYPVSEAIGSVWLRRIGFVPFIVGVMAIPISTGVAILRYRLYDIDIIINRTLVYGSLTATLLAIYFGAVVLLQRLLVALAGEKSTLAVVASTLLIAAMFTPLRRRIQSFIDRRFYRRKYDAAKTLAAFTTPGYERRPTRAHPGRRSGGRGEADDATGPRLFVAAPRDNSAAREQASE